MENKYQIFISYRRDGGGELAQLLYERLDKRGYKAFFDQKGLGSGAFNNALYERIAESTDVLAVLSPKGLDRCVDPEDWVRKELSRALELKKNIIPIMMEGFTWPKELPENLADLPNQNGVNAYRDYYDAVFEKIISFLRSRPLNGDSSDKILFEYAKKGDTQAMNELGLRYEFGSESISINLATAFSYYQQAAEKGDPAGLYNLGDVYERCADDLTLTYQYGIEVENSAQMRARRELREKAVSCYTQSAGTGFLPAVCRLGDIAHNGHDYKKALEFYQEAADQGYQPAMNALGYYLSNGIETDTDARKARELFKEASKGYAPAVFNYAHILEKSDTEEAIKLYSQIDSGENAIPEASYALGKLYEEQKQDYVNAAKAYRRALYGGITKAEQDLKNCWDKIRAKQKTQSAESE